MISRTARVARAVWRDSSALWQEFRVPIFIFAITIFGGGFIYGELHAAAGYERIPYIDLPYIMLGMMVLEGVIDLPHEAQLALFWYVLPFIGVYIVGRGAVDFIRLFFNRGERRNAWEEAVASTYRNHIIVLGVGHVGLRVVRTLVQMGFEVVGIDQNLGEEIDNLLSQLGVPVIIGDGRSTTILEKAGIQHAQALIVCTSSDHLNMEVTMRVREMNPSVRIVVRMWDNQFAGQMKRFLGVDAVISSSDLTAPVFAGAAVGVEIAQTLNIHGVDYSMIRLQVSPGSFMEGHTIKQLQNENDMDIVLHERDNEVDVHPPSDTTIRSGDTVVVFARHDQIIDLVSRNYSQAARD
jgi:Trk K+ transport system NAD-binding subunit